MTKARNQLTLIQLDKDNFAAIERCRVRLNQSTKNWEVTFPIGRVEEYVEPDAVIFAVSKYFERIIRWKKAQELIFALNLKMLSLKEALLLSNIEQSGRCTKRQYGYLKGIWERQQ